LITPLVSSNSSYEVSLKSDDTSWTRKEGRDCDYDKRKSWWLQLNHYKPWVL